MEVFLEELADKILFVIIGACFIVGILAKAFTTIVTSSAQERSRREIAAYIAEGSLTPEHGERLLKAEVKGSSARC